MPRRPPFQPFDFKQGRVVRRTRVVLVSNGDRLCLASYIPCGLPRWKHFLSYRYVCFYFYLLHFFFFFVGLFHLSDRGAVFFFYFLLLHFAQLIFSLSLFFYSTSCFRHLFIFHSTRFVLSFLFYGIVQRLLAERACNVLCDMPERLIYKYMYYLSVYI